jgi:hypothetical protein
MFKNMIRTGLLSGAVTLTLAGCASPYADDIKTAREACKVSGDYSSPACYQVLNLVQADTQWHAEKAAEANRAAAIIGIGLMGAAAGFAAAHPPPPPAPVFVPAPHMMNCTSNAVGQFVYTNCF